MSLSAAIFLCLSAGAVDGDTLRCANVPEANGRVRLARIDTPERGEPGYAEATALLESLLTGPVECRLVDADARRAGFQAQDRYGRRVARCRVEGRDLSAAMLASGLARVWPVKSRISGAGSASMRAKFHPEKH